MLAGEDIVLFYRNTLPVRTVPFQRGHKAVEKQGKALLLDGRKDRSHHTGRKIYRDNGAAKDKARFSRGKAGKPP